MRAHRKLKSAICQVLIGLLLFTQAAFAARPCVDSEMSAAAALAMAKDHECCETVVSEATLCVVKCTDEDKVSAHTPLLIPPPADHAVIAVVARDDARAQRLRPGADTAVRDPPKTIRFCSFLI